MKHTCCRRSILALSVLLGTMCEAPEEEAFTTLRALEAYGTWVTPAGEHFNVVSAWQPLPAAQAFLCTLTLEIDSNSRPDGYVKRIAAIDSNGRIISHSTESGWWSIFEASLNDVRGLRFTPERLLCLDSSGDTIDTRERFCPRDYQEYCDSYTAPAERMGVRLVLRESNSVDGVSAVYDNGYVATEAH